MATIEEIIYQMRQMKEEEFAILSYLEKYFTRFRITPIKTIQDTFDIPKKSLDKYITEIVKKKLVSIKKVPYDGLILKPLGLDILSIKDLVDRNIIDSFGNKIGVGKESDVYEALDPHGSKVSIKIYRIGKSSFKDVIKKRRYLQERNKNTWMVRNIKSAKREYEIMKKLSNANVSVPKPLAISNHILVMEYLDGEIVANSRRVEKPEIIFEETIDVIKNAYGLGVINSDLSSFNVFVTKYGKVFVIDWPQWTSSTSQNANEKLKSDVINLYEYFNRRFSINRDINQIINYIQN